MHILINDDYLIVFCWILHDFCDDHAMMFFRRYYTAINSPLHETVLFVVCVYQPVIVRCMKMC